MNLKDSNCPCVLVEGPRWGDAAFYGEWLMLAARANALWEIAIKEPRFKEQVFRLVVHHFPDFGICAIELLARLKESFASFIVRPVGDEEECVVEVMMMFAMGFFVRTGQRYQMVIPTRLSMARVKKAALKLAATMDEEHYLHPERLVVTMPYAEAKTWQGRLRRMNNDHRCADRRLLLETPSDFKIARPAALKVRAEN